MLATTCLLLLAAGCGQRLEAPLGLHSPYGEQQLWAVAPLANESGVSFVDTAQLADVFADQVQQVAGVNVLPVNRVIVAMREADMPAVQTLGDARTLMNHLDVDALVVGTVTAYDPYRPPRLGLAVQLFAADQDRAFSSFNPRDLTHTTVGELAPGGLTGGEPVAQAAGIFDAANHDTLMSLRTYAAGRTEPDSAYGDDIYLVRMELFARFVSFQLIRDLLTEEQARLTLATTPDGAR
ncbi:MAG: hypothetical protein ACYTGG_03175 [Planctomycetota bacterium]